MRAGKTFAGDMTIKDVCRQCNNGPLSKLDAYICQLYDEYFAYVPKPRKSIEFQYDFSLLMRWLLKISYNASRSTGIDADVLSQYTSVLISDYPTSPVHAAAFVQTAKAGWLKKPSTRNRRKIEPMGTRCGPVLIPGVGYQEWCALRAVIINGFMFTILLMRQPTVEPDVANELRSRIYGVSLSPDDVIRIPSPKKTALDFLEGVQHWPRGHR